MTLPENITPEAYEWAEIFMDAHRGVEDDRELLALAFMELSRTQERAGAGLTKKQADAYQFICAYHAANGCPPSYREIGERFGVGLGRVHDLVNDLVERGCITMMPGRARSIALVGRA
jgi:DNA-binding MarR family transcriptional regulator